LWHFWADYQYHIQESTIPFYTVISLNLITVMYLHCIKAHIIPYYAATLVYMPTQSLSYTLKNN
jgi:hypothetical protein